MNKNAFTLIEIAITTVIVALLGIMAVPNMLSMVNRSYSQDVLHNLVAIYGAQQNYAQNNNNAFKDCDWACINDSSGLGLSIVSSGGITYSCNSSSCTSTPTSNTGNFTMSVSLTDPIKTQSSAFFCDPGGPNDTNPCCSGGDAGKLCP